MVRIPDETRGAIVAALRAGMRPLLIARQYGVSKTSVLTIGRDAGLDFSNHAPKSANVARRDYALAGRLDLLNRGFDKAQELLDAIKAPHELQQWSVAVGTLIDKRRLEDGEATSRTEDVADVRSRVAGRLDELAARRGTREATG